MKHRSFYTQNVQKIRYSPARINPLGDIDLRYNLNSKGNNMKRLLLLFILSACPFIYAVENNAGDIVAKVSKNLPVGWSVKLSAFNGKCFVNVLTDEIDTTGSMRSNGGPGITKQRLTISIQVMPRYSRSMLKRIQDHNAPIKAKLKKLEYFSQEYRDIDSTLIDEPMFYDDIYGFSVCYPSWIPTGTVDKQKFVQFLKNISENWKSYDLEQPDVNKILVSILTQ